MISEFTIEVISILASVTVFSAGLATGGAFIALGIIIAAERLTESWNCRCTVHPDAK